MNLPIIYNGEAGQTLTVMPISATSDLDDWVANSVAMVESVAPNAGQYVATVDTDVSLRWALFAAGSQPADWSGALVEFDLTDEILLASVGGAGGSIDSTGTETITMAKALEILVAYIANAASRTAVGESWDYTGRDGVTDILTGQPVPTETARGAAVITP